MALVLLTGCKAWDPTMLAPKNDPITPKLLTLERRIEDFANTRVVVNDDELMVFTKEVESNLMDPYGDKYGYIALKTNVIEVKNTTILWFLSFFTAYIPNVLGMPIIIIRYKVEVELRIFDRDNKMVSKYTAIGNSRVVIAFYYGYSFMDGLRKAYPDALLNAFDKIRPQIQADSQRVNEKLLSVGRIKNVP